MKRAPVPRPEWIRTCRIDHDSGNIIDFPVIDDLPSLLWVINLGCIDLNQWYGQCDDVNRPELARELAGRHPDLMTAEYRVAKRPAGRVLVDYNQNAWGRTLASVYSVRPRPQATVSTPVTWDEIDKGVRIKDFRIDNVRTRFAEVGDLWTPLLRKTGRVNLGKYV